MSDLTLETLATALQRHLLPVPSDPADDAVLVWDRVLGGGVPESIEDVAGLLDDLAGLYLTWADDARADDLTRLRGFLREFMDWESTEAALAMFLAESQPEE